MATLLDPSCSRAPAPCTPSGSTALVLKLHLSSTFNPQPSTLDPHCSSSHIHILNSSSPIAAELADLDSFDQHVGVALISSSSTSSHSHPCEQRPWPVLAQTNFDRRLAQISCHCQLSDYPPSQSDTIGPYVRSSTKRRFSDGTGGENNGKAVVAERLRSLLSTPTLKIPSRMQSGPASPAWLQDLSPAQEEKLRSRSPQPAIDLSSWALPNSATFMSAFAPSTSVSSPAFD